MSSSPYYKRLATAGTDKLGKGQTGQRVKIHNMILTADAQSTVVFTDGTLTITIDVRPGTNRFKRELAFTSDADVTITVTGGNVSIFGDVFYG